MVALLALMIGAVATLPASWATDVPGANMGRITVHTTGYPEDKGVALIQLANSAEDYDGDDSGFRGAEIPIANKEATAVFTDVPYGEYAVKVFHDANQNRKLDFGLMGPKEAYGFSNNARGRFGPPGYEEVKFVLAENELTIEIEVK
jgi:uncharacterized protein (DUF2141 family)